MSSSAPGSGPSGSNSASFDTFYKDLKETELKDSVLTPTQQIDRLLRPGSTYRNLNPFEVLKIDPHTKIDEIKKKYRRMSILVHPDKNPNNSERAQAAFDAVKKAYEMLSDDNTHKLCMEVVEEAEGRTKQNMEIKRKEARKQRGLGANADCLIEEDNPVTFKHAVYVLTMKLFADLERKRRAHEQKLSDNAAKKRAAELEAESRKNMEKEFTKNWEESRQGRVNSWMDFKSGKAAAPSTSSAPDTPAPAAAPKKAKKEKKAKKFSPMGFRPPKTKPESR